MAGTCFLLYFLSNKDQIHEHHRPSDGREKETVVVKKRHRFIARTKVSQLAVSTNPKYFLAGMLTQIRGN